MRRLDGGVGVPQAVEGGVVDAKQQLAGGGGGVGRGGEGVGRGGWEGETGGGTRNKRGGTWMMKACAAGEELESRRG